MVEGLGRDFAGLMIQQAEKDESGGSWETPNVREQLRSTMLTLHLPCTCAPKPRTGMMNKDHIPKYTLGNILVPVLN
jgi:hypothetical protein